MKVLGNFAWLLFISLAVTALVNAGPLRNDSRSLERRQSGGGGSSEGGEWDPSSPTRQIGSGSYSSRDSSRSSSFPRGNYETGESSRAGGSMYGVSRPSRLGSFDRQFSGSSEISQDNSPRRITDERALSLRLSQQLSIGVPRRNWAFETSPPIQRPTGHRVEARVIQELTPPPRNMPKLEGLAKYEAYGALPWQSSSPGIWHKRFPIYLDSTNPTKQQLQQALRDYEGFYYYYNRPQRSQHALKVSLERSGIITSALSDHGQRLLDTDMQQTSIYEERFGWFTSHIRNGMPLSPINLEVDRTDAPEFYLDRLNRENGSRTRQQQLARMLQALEEKAAIFVHDFEDPAKRTYKLRFRLDDVDKIVAHIKLLHSGEITLI